MALAPVAVLAAGLGKLSIMSGLGEPLKASIELISTTPAELSTLTANIASEETYKLQGLEKPASHNFIKVEIAKDSAGQPIIKLKSDQPISEPFLDMLIQVDWSSGRLLREYTVLLDPPGYTGETDSSVQVAQTPMEKSSSHNKNEQMVNDTKIKGGASSASVSKHSKNMASVSEDETAASSEDYMTQRGDTLSKIARNMKPEGVSLEQMLIGLYQTNPEAFQGENINRLKVGKILRQPSQDTLNSISTREAASEIKVHAANWNAYRNKLAGMVADTTPTDSETSSQSAGGTITRAEDKSEVPATGPKDVVKLSAGEVATKGGSDELKSMQAKITALQEEATAREKSVKEAQDRTADLEKQVADMQKLLAMKNDAMADIQKQATSSAGKPAEGAAAPVEAAKQAEPAKAETVAPAENKSKPAITPAEAAPAEAQGFFASLLEGLNFSLLAPAGGLLALLGVGWLYLRKRREKNLADFEQGIMTSGGLKANTVFGNTASASVDTGDTSFLTDFSQSASDGMADSNDVDPIAEAEVYMAYGRDAQAEEILKDAISKEPKRHELHLKLLEMYAASKNLPAFETIAGELYTSLGAEDPMWAKVVEIGIKLEPNNPLYQANSVPTGMSNSLDADDFSNTPLAGEKDLDFSFDDQSLAQNKAEDTMPATPTADEPTFDLPQFDMENSGEVTPTQSSEAVATQDSALDFDLGGFGELDTKVSDTLVENPTALNKDNEAGFINTMPAFDMPNFDAPKSVLDIPADTGEDVAENILDISDAINESAESMPSFNFPQQETPVASEAEAASGDEAVLDLSDMQTELTPDDFNSSTDFNFDIHTITPEAANYVEEGAVEANAFDLNTINLELNDNAGTAEAEKVADTATETLNVTGDEPIEVETKLELVAAYIEMDDKEGAKELLEEVIKEGGTAQRKRAEALLAQLS